MTILELPLPPPQGVCSYTTCTNGYGQLYGGVVSPGAEEQLTNVLHPIVVCMVQKLALSTTTCYCILFYFIILNNEEVFACFIRHTYHSIHDPKGILSIIDHVASMKSIKPLCVQVLLPYMYSIVIRSVPQCVY